MRRRKAGTFGNRSDLGAIDRGRVMHPRWGRGPLVGPQMVTPGGSAGSWKGSSPDGPRKKSSPHSIASWPPWPAGGVRPDREEKECVSRIKGVEYDSSSIVDAPLDLLFELNRLSGLEGQDVVGRNPERRCSRAVCPACGA